jgi:molybdate transport system ATP-binding protein
VRLIELVGASLRLNDTDILEGIYFSLSHGEVIWLRGANGAGKSSLLKLLRGDLWPTSGGRRYGFTDPPRASPIGARERIALVTPEMQDRLRRLEYGRSALELMQTGFAGGDYVYVPLTEEQKVRALETMRALRLEALMERPVMELSQGQLRQVLLARGVVGKPDVLLLDEFFAGVDADSRLRLKTLVSELARGGLTLLYTTHRDEERLAETTREVRLEAGKMLKGDVLAERPTVGASNPCSRHTHVCKAQRETHAAPLHTDDHELLLEIRNANVYLGDPRDDATAQDGHAASVKNHVLHDINFSLARGQHTALLGANGAGKTTLSRVLLGEVSPAVGGTVRWFGAERIPLWERQARIGVVSGDLETRHRVDADGFTVVASGYGNSVGWHRQLEAAESKRVRVLLELIGVAHLATRSALQLSQGELRKLLIARALVNQPEVLILDEAFDYLDATSRGHLFSTLESLSDRITFIVISHWADEIPTWVRRAVKLEAGRVISDETMRNS